MNFLYNLGINAYRLGAKIASRRNVKARRMLDGQGQTFSYLAEHLDDAGGYIWIHVSSLGEFEQGRPLIERLRRERPSERILLTFFSPSGYELRKNYDKVDAVCYLPFDTPSNVRRFLDVVKPKMAIFVKYEYWGNYLQELHKRSVPTYIISAIFREKQIFFKPWGGMFRKMLSCFTSLFVQDDESRELLEGIGVKNAIVCGDTRFDRVADIRAAARDFPIIESFVSDARFTLVAGSSWQPDEDIIIPYFNSHPGMKLIIAPHEYDETRLADLLSRLTRPSARYSDVTCDNAASLDCLVIDQYGLLSSLYRYGTMAEVGGGFGIGIHNVNEAAAHGIPVVFGPKYDKFREARDLIACGAAFSVNNADEFAALMNKMLSNNQEVRKSGNIALQYINTHLGATEKIYKEIFNH